MAKYSVTYGCGHDGTLDLWGPTKDREWRIKGAETQDCPDCYKAKQLAKAEKIETESHLPELQGSEKQVSWAKTIRAKLIAELDALIAKNGMPANPTGQQAIEKLRGEQSANWWIDRRDQSLQTILGNVAKEIADRGMVNQ